MGSHWVHVLVHLDVQFEKSVAHWFLHCMMGGVTQAALQVVFAF